MRAIGRYELWTRIAAGGMGAVHLGCVRGEAGFRRAVAIKSMHQAIASDQSLVASFIDEARLTARLRHPNLVATLDVVAEGDDLILVMEYVHGEALSHLAHLSLAKPDPVPVKIAVGIMVGALHGLHAAHGAVGDDGTPLGLVHRDVSPQNIIVGADGVSRVADFGVAKAAGRLQQTTGEGSLKGKISYMAPEQLMSKEVDRRADIFALGVVLWEILTGVRLFGGSNEGATIGNVLSLKIDKPSARMAQAYPELDEIVMKALQRDSDDRFATARDMARALEKTGLAAPAADIGDWVQERASVPLSKRAETIAEIERADKRSTDSLERLAAKIASSSSKRDVNDVGNDNDTTATTPPKEGMLTTTTGTTAEVIVAALADTETAELSTTFRRAERTTPFSMRRVLLVAFPVAVLVMVGVVVLRSPPQAKVSEPTATTTTTAGADAWVSMPADSATAVTVASASAAPIAPSATTTTTTSSAPKPTQARPIATAARPTASVRAVASGCADPYTRDELGRKIYKRECLTE